MHTQATVQWEFSKSCPDTRRKVGVFGGSRRPPTRGRFISKRLRVMEARWAHPDPGVRAGSRCEVAQPQKAAHGEQSTEIERGLKDGLFVAAIICVRLWHLEPNHKLIASVKKWEIYDGGEGG